MKEVPSYLRIAKLFELMNEGSESAVAEIKRVVVEDICPLVRHEAIFALGEMGDKGTVPFLREVAASGDHYVVVHEALVSIGTLGGDEDIDFLEKFAKSNNPVIAHSAQVAMARIGQGYDMTQLLKENKKKYMEELFDYEGTDYNYRIQILFQLMLDGEEDSLKAMHRSLKEDPSAVVRHEAGFSLGEVDNDVVVAYMSDALKSEHDPVVLHETLFALGTTGKKEALEAIEGFLDHEDYVVRESARIAKDRVLYLDEPYSGARHFA